MKQISKETKDAILTAVKGGTSVTDAGTEYGVSTKTIYRWLSAEARGTGVRSLELNRLRKENAELKEIVALLSLDKSRAEKNTARAKAYA